MNLNDYYRYCDSLVPESPEEVLPSVSTTALCKRDIINDAQIEFCRITRCLPKENSFNCTANTSSYALSSIAPDYLEMKEEGVWHLRSSTSTTWERLEPTTIRQMDEDFSTWRDQNKSDFCYKYWIEGDMLNVFYIPSSSLTNGFKIYYYALPSTMTNLTDYPFTGATESSRLKPYEKVLLVYYEYRALGFLGYKDDSKAKELEFYELCTNAREKMDSRRDIAQVKNIRVKTGLKFGNPYRR